MPKIKVKGQTVQTGELGNADKSQKTVQRPRWFDYLQALRLLTYTCGRHIRASAKFDKVFEMVIFGLNFTIGFHICKRPPPLQIAKNSATPTLV